MVKQLPSKKQKIDRVPICFSGFVALMLVQTPYMRIGTIIAFTTIMLTLLAFGFNRNTVKITTFNVSLFAFVLLVFIRSALNSEINSYKLILQGIMCIFLASYEANKSDSEFLKRVVEISSVVYAILIIGACMKMGDTKYIHGTIELFRTSLDPNFAGLPLVMGASFLLYNVFEKRKMMFSLTGFAIILVAIFYTASRGNAITILSICVLELVAFFFAKKVSLTKKIFMLILAIAFLGALFYYLSNNMGAQWDRMSNFGQGSDNGRFELWKKALDMWLDNLIFGVGIGGFVSSVGMATHNTYLTVLVETGFVGMILFIVFIGCLVKKSLKCGFDVFVMLIAVLIHMSFLDALDSRCVWAAIGFVAIYFLPERGVYSDKKYD